MTTWPQSANSARPGPWNGNLDRVGIFGLSGGGFATVRSMATFPDFYKVGVAEAGTHAQPAVHVRLERAL